MLVKLKVHPGSKARSLLRKGGDSYEAWVRAPAEDGRANREALELLGRELGVAAGALRIVKGGKSPNKIVTVPGGG